MVILYGLTHGAREIGIFGGSREIAILPSREFLDHLARFPTGTKVGVEWGFEQQRQEVQRNLSELCRMANLPGEGYYSEHAARYWNEIITTCRKKKYNLLLMEDKNIWFRYHEAIIELQKHEARLKRERESGHDDSSLEKTLQEQEAGYHLYLQSRKIHEIDRDDSLLQKISQVDIALVGKAHSDHWLQYKKVECERYSTDTVHNHGLGEFRTVFTEKAVPNPRIAYERISLERSLRLMETGRISEQTADYVGTWDLHNPWQGYFELFVQQQSKGKFSGTIEDGIGSATFEGWFRPNGIDFVKQYQESTEDAIKGPIYYYAEGSEKKEFAGRFSTDIGGMAFYMVQSAQESPGNLLLRWRALIEKHRREKRKVSSE